MIPEKLYCMIRPDLDCTPKCGIYLYHKLALNRVENNPKNRPRVIQAGRDSYLLLNNQEWRKRLSDSVISTLNEHGYEATKCANFKVLDKYNDSKNI